MDLNYLRRLMKIFDESTASEITIEEEGLKVKLSKRQAGNIKLDQSGAIPQAMYLQQYPAIGHQQEQPKGEVLTAAAKIAANEEAVSESTSVEMTDATLLEVRSPIVGTFYRSPSPDSPAFVDIGTHVNAGSTLCIIEAMKLMNEIESEIPGTIVKILVQNAQPIEFNQPLFLIKPD